MTERNNNRGISLAVGMVINLLVGIAYAWSVFVLPLNERNGWSMSKLAMAYTIMSVTLMIANMTIVPFLRKKMSFRSMLMLGAVLYGGGIALGGFVTNIYLFYLVFSVAVGMGNALIYPVLMTYSQQLYHEKPGFASGMMAAGYGLGAVVWATVASQLYSRTMDIALTMLVLGVAFLIGILIGAMFLREIPERFITVATQKEQITCLCEKNRGQMLKDSLFPVVYICMIMGLICGNMIITQGSPIMQKNLAVTPETAALLVSVFSLGNTLGRPVWGKISDGIGRVRSFVLLHGIMAVSMATLFMCDIKIVFIGAICLVMLCYGGIATLIAPMTRDFWGAKHLSENYGVTFSIFGVSTLIGAPMIAAILESTGGYEMAFFVGLVMEVVGLASAIVLLKKAKS